MGARASSSEDPLPVWAVPTLVAHPVQALLQRRLNGDAGVFMLWGAWGCGKHTYMREAAARMREAKTRDVFWVNSGLHPFKKPIIPWLGKTVLGREVADARGLVAGLSRPATIFVHHSELLFGDKGFAQVLGEIAVAIRCMERDVNVIVANSRPENARAALRAGVQLLGEPECCRWRESHVREYVERHPHAKTLSQSARDRLVQIGTRAGAVGFIEMWLYSTDAQDSYGDIGQRWRALDTL